ncbi:MAG: hypothetical protein KAQ71_10925 [Desulfobulbaceae bacterium]|nr:hypothetical protein [Desulfobulbaceae bacterium]
MKKLVQEYLNKFKDNELSLDEIRDLRHAKENSVEKKSTGSYRKLQGKRK